MKRANIMFSFLRLGNRHIKRTLLSGLIVILLVLPQTLWAPQWLDLNPAAKSPPLFGHTMVELNGVPYVFGGLGSGPSNDLWRYDPNNNAWNKVVTANSPPTARYYHSAVVNGGKMYICGGAADGTVFSLDIWIYDPNTNRWSQRPVVGVPPGPRFLHSAATLPDGSILIFGGLGYDYQPTDNFLWQCDPNGVWKEKSAYPGGTPYGHTAVVFDGKMYIFGGYYSQGYSNDMVVYDPNQDSWQKLPVQGNLPQARCLYGAAQQGNSLLIFGGEGKDNVELNDTWQFNTMTNTWTQCSNTPVPLAETRATTFSALQVFVFGGRSGGTATNRTFLYSFSAGRLTSIQITPRNPTMFVGQSLTFTAQGYDPNGIQVPINNPQWEYSQNCGTVFVCPNDPNNCTFTTAQKGNGWVACWQGPMGEPNGIHGSTNITIKQPGRLTSIQITPQNPTMYVGQSLTFTAQGYDPNGNPTFIQNPVWFYYSKYGRVTLNPNDLTRCTFTAIKAGTGVIACYQGPFDPINGINEIHGSTDIYIRDPNQADG